MNSARRGSVSGRPLKRPRGLRSPDSNSFADNKRHKLFCVETELQIVNTKRSNKAPRARRRSRPVDVFAFSPAQLQLGAFHARLLFISASESFGFPINSDWHAIINT